MRNLTVLLERLAPCFLFFACCGAAPIIEGPDITGMYETVGASDNEHPVHVLIVHGMGLHNVGYSEKLRARLTARLGEFQSPKCEDFRLANDPNHLPADRISSTLRVCAYENKKGNVVQFYELTWSPITSPVKDRLLGYDDVEYGPTREEANRRIKRNIVNYGLSDPIIYLGRYEMVLRFAVKQMLCSVVTKKLQNDQVCSFPETSSSIGDIFVITHSLGSAILYDAIKEMQVENSKEGGKQEGRAARYFKEKTRYVYMLANQLPLLCINKYSIDNRTCEESDRRTPDDFRTSIAAISDPNDLFSYPLKPWHLDLIGLQGVPTNVFIDIAGWSLARTFGDLADPEVAHTGHADNDEVIDILACGTISRRVNKC